MSQIGEIVTQNQLASIQRENEASALVKGYVNPTVWRPGNIVMSKWNYYGSLSVAAKQLAWLNKFQGSAQQSPAGQVQLPGSAAITLGVGVDFFAFVPFLNRWVPVPYGWLTKFIKASPLATVAGLPLVYRFYTTDYKGPYWAIFDVRYFAITATVIEKVAKNKLEAMDAMHRAIAEAKANFNAYSVFLRESSNRNLTPREQKLFNSAVIQLRNYEAALRKIQGVDFDFQPINSGIGEPVSMIIWIVGFIIAGIVVAWSVQKIADTTKAIKNTGAAYDFKKFVGDKRSQLMADLNGGKITQAQYNAEVAALDKSEAAADQSIKDNDKDRPGIFDGVTKLALVLGLVFVGSKFIGKKNNS